MQNVGQVDAKLCTGCCECISACAANNICIMFDVALGHPVPFVSEDTCTECGSCISQCKQGPLINLQIS